MTAETVTRPDRAGPTTLYRAYNQAGDLLYVGISVNVTHRLQQHAVDSPWWGEAERIEKEEYPTRAEAARAEERAIWRERPQWNKVHAMSTAVLKAVPETAEEQLARLDVLTATIRQGEKDLDAGKTVVEGLLRSGVTVREMSAVGAYSPTTLRNIRAAMRKRGEVLPRQAERADSRRLVELGRTRKAAEEAHREANELVRAILLSQRVKARELINRPFSEPWVRNVRAEMKRRGEIA